MPKVLVIQSFHEAGMQLLQARSDVEYEIVDGSSMAETMARIEEADGVTIRTTPLPGEVLQAARRLKVVARHGVGYDNIDLAWLTGRRIPLAITADANATSVAEHVLFMMLELAKRGRRYDRATREGGWAVRNDLSAVDLAGRQVLILGFGRIGRAVAARCLAFEMQVVAYDPFVDAETIEAVGCRAVADFRAALPETDILTLHLPMSSNLRHLIGATELAALPAHAFLINCARGGLVDEAALGAALHAGRLAGAGVDVFEQEPPPEDHPLFGLDNVVLSPHSAGLTMECARRMAISTARNVLAGIDGTLDPAMVVNREVLQ